MRTDVVAGADMCVIYCRGGLRFRLETRQSLCILGNFVREKFQSDEAMEAGVFRFVDDSHSTAAEFFHDAVMGYVLAYQRLGFRHLAHIISGVTSVRRTAVGLRVALREGKRRLMSYSFTR